MAPISDSQSFGNSVAVVSSNQSLETDGSGSNPGLTMQEVKGSLLNPLAKEFVPASRRGNQSPGIGFSRMRPNNSQAQRRISGRAFRAQQDSVRRTVYVSEVDHEVSEEELASVFMGRCGQVIDCRICGDPKSPLRIAFVELADERGAKEALGLTGTLVGLYTIKVVPSKTAILPVNPIFLPRSPNEMALVARTVYCTNIDSMISEAEVWFFFQSCCGEVTRLRLLGEYMKPTRIAFVEFAMSESAIAALGLSGVLLGSLQIRISPSKTPIRGPRPDQE